MIKKTKNLLNLIFILAVISFLGNPIGAAAQLINPLTGVAKGTEPGELYGRIISGFMGVLGAAALTMFVWGGFLWLTSAGNPEKIKKGRDTLVWAVIGIIIVFSSYIILSYVITTVTGGAGVSSSTASKTATSPVSEEAAPAAVNPDQACIDAGGECRNPCNASTCSFAGGYPGTCRSGLCSGGATNVCCIPPS